MSTDAFKMERILHRRDTSSYCGYRRLGIALDSNRNQLHHALVHSAGIACVDVETGQTISITAMPGTSGAKDCAFSTPENICCCAEGRSILCFDSRQPSVAMQVHAIQSAVSAISCSNDGRYVAYSSSDSSVGLFSLRMSCVVRPGLFHTSCVNSCYFQDDNSGFWTAGSDKMVSKFKAETGTSQMNFKDHADPVLVCKPARDGSMIATGAADHAVVLRHTVRDRLKSVKDKVVLLGHSVPVTEALFTNDNKGLCSFGQDGSILLWDVDRSSVLGNDLKDLCKRSQMSTDERNDFEETCVGLQQHCEQFIAARTSVFELCVSSATFNQVICACDSNRQSWKESPFLHRTVPHSSQRCPGDLSVSRSRKLVGDTGIGKAIVLPESCAASGNLIICSCKQGVVMIRINTEILC